MSVYSEILAWLISTLLLPLTAVLRLVGLLLPPCSSLGVVSFGEDVLNQSAQLVRFLWPFLQFFPWTMLWHLISIILLYGFFRFLWRLWPTLVSFGPQVWLIIGFVYLVSGLYAVLLNPLNAFKAADYLAGGQTEVVTSGSGTIYFDYRCDLQTPCRDNDGDLIDWHSTATYGVFIFGETSAPRWQFWNTASSTWEVINL
jgi:hypothetical protein